MDVWHNAITKGEVAILSYGSTHWKPVMREDHREQLQSWMDGVPFEVEWLILTPAGVPHYFSKNGFKEHVKIIHSLNVCGYNLLTAREDGDPYTCSMFEDHLVDSKQFRVWANRRDNVAKSLVGTHVVGCCECTMHMLGDISNRIQRLTPVAFELKIGQYDGSAVFIDESRVAYQHHVVHRLGGAQIALLCYLKDKKTNTDFLFVVLHLESDGRANGHMALEHVRVKQACKLKQKLSSVRIPIIIVGDFNSDRFLYERFERKRQPTVASVLDSYKTVLPLKATYLHFGEAAFDDILVKGAYPTSKSTIPKASIPCPNAEQGSDHLPVYASLLLQHPG